MPETGFTDIINNVSHVEQQRANFCGPACGQMFAAKYSLTLLQAEVFSRISEANTEPPPIFWTDPAALAAVLNVYLEAALSFPLADYSTSTMDELLQQMYFTMNILKAPCISLISKGMHWVVLDGFREQVSSTGERALLGAWVEDPWFGRPADKYLTMTELMDKGYFSPVERGVKWLNKFVFLTRVDVRDLLEDNHFYKPRVVVPLSAGGGGAGVESAALQSLDLHGFQNARPVVPGGGAPVVSPITVQDLGTGETYEIVPLDATLTVDFEEYVYVAMESGGQQRLLEIERLRYALDAFSDDEALALIGKSFPGAQIAVEPGYFWQRGRHFKSRFQVARRCVIDGRRMFLLQNGQISDTLAEPEVFG